LSAGLPGEQQRCSQKQRARLHRSRFKQPNAAASRAATWRRSKSTIRQELAVACMRIVRHSFGGTASFVNLRQMKASGNNVYRLVDAGHGGHPVELGGFEGEWTVATPRFELNFMRTCRRSEEPDTVVIAGMAGRQLLNRHGGVARMQLLDHGIDVAASDRTDIHDLAHTQAERPA
jgi:hypothetical protein